ncbi:hypothetical protein BLA29_002509 [Euroglyphus maynei]|uniref:Uncharacterized protein n=1 Tax=Euroglyphus maynei TaxID=6958 RepID=A0A1Y3BDQ6_EURMA|nr:hypothetical protein BLA29_002509 [Euroglyphus maynei]
MNCELSSAQIWSLDDWIKDQCHDDDDNDTIINLQCDRLPEPKWLDKHSKRMDYLFIKGNRIRYFHLPEEINVIDCIEKQLEFYRQRSTANNKTIQRPFNWKSYRKKLKLMQQQPKQDEKNSDNKSTTSQ